METGSDAQTDEAELYDFDYHKDRKARDIVSRARVPPTLGTAGIPWQIPAVGDQYLSADEARYLAGYLEANDDPVMRFLLAGVDPSELARRLRLQAQKLDDATDDADD